MVRLKHRLDGRAVPLREVIEAPGLSWLMISYDSVMTNKGRYALWNFLKKRRCFYVVDESMFIKAPRAKRTKRIVSSGAYAPYRRLLCGTKIKDLRRGFGREIGRVRFCGRVGR